MQKKYFFAIANNADATSLDVAQLHDAIHVFDGDETAAANYYNQFNRKFLKKEVRISDDEAIEYQYEPFIPIAHITTKLGIVFYTMSLSEFMPKLSIPKNVFCDMYAPITGDINLNGIGKFVLDVVKIDAGDKDAINMRMDGHDMTVKVRPYKTSLNIYLTATQEPQNIELSFERYNGDANIPDINLFIDGDASKVIVNIKGRTPNTMQTFINNPVVIHSSTPLKSINLNNIKCMSFNSDMFAASAYILDSCFVANGVELSLPHIDYVRFDEVNCKSIKINSEALLELQIHNTTAEFIEIANAKNINQCTISGGCFDTLTLSNVNAKNIILRSIKLNYDKSNSFRSKTINTTLQINKCELAILSLYSKVKSIINDSVIDTLEDSYGYVLFNPNILQQISHLKLQEEFHHCVNDFHKGMVVSNNNTNLKVSIVVQSTRLINNTSAGVSDFFNIISFVKAMGVKLENISILSVSSDFQITGDNITINHVYTNNVYYYESELSYNDNHKTVSENYYKNHATSWEVMAQEAGVSIIDNPYRQLKIKLNFKQYIQNGSKDITQLYVVLLNHFYNNI